MHHPARHRRATRTFAALGIVGLVSVIVPVRPVAATDLRPTAGQQASVSFPLSLPASTSAVLARLSSRPGRGATRAKIVQSLAPPASQSRVVQRWADQHEFAVVHSSRWLVEVRGDAGDLAAALGTRSGKAYLDGKTYPVASGRLHVPAELQGVVAAPVGLDERPVYRRRGVYGGGDVQAMGDLPVRGGGAGADVTVGTLNLSGWHPSDLAEYATSYGLRTPQVQNVLVGSGHVLATATEDSQGLQSEVALDAEAIAGTAPGATQRMYFGGNSDADYLAILSAMADDAAAGLLQTASTSWGACEPQMSSAELAAESSQIDRMVAAGATFFAASGDSGSYDCSTPSAPDTNVSVDWPAAEVNTVGVGGTHVSGDAVSGFSPPTSWSLAGGSGGYAGSGSGGGCSAFVDQPQYQLTMPWQATVPSCWSEQTPKRAVPDIAALADPSTGYAVYDSAHGWIVAGGTSLAAPISAAGLAVYLSSQADKHGVGNILGVAYQHPEAFTDVTSGNNGQWVALQGYDNVTGLGVPDWRLLGAAIRGVPADAARPASSNPLFLAPHLSASLLVPYFDDLNGGGLNPIWVRADGSRTCTGVGLDLSTDGQGTKHFTLPSGTQDGAVTVTLSGSDPSMGCRATTRQVFVDRKVPNALPVATYTGTTAPRFTLSWSVSDPAPSSGSDGYTVKVTDITSRQVRVNLAWTATRSLSLTAITGHRYTLQVIAYDRAGNASPSRTTAFASYDDRSATLSQHLSNGAYVGDWTRINSAIDYAGSHVASARTGSGASFTFTGNALTAGVIKSRYGGYADIYVDGIKKARISLFASSTLYRQSVRLATVSSYGTHKVLVRVVGAHQAGSLGNYIYLDRLTVT